MELASNYLIVKHRTFPVVAPRPGESGYDPEYTIACTKVMGQHRGRVKAFRPASIVNVSGMSFGSLSGSAVEALNLGSVIAGCLHNTGEGGVSPHHLRGGSSRLADRHRLLWLPRARWAVQHEPSEGDGRATS